MRHDTILHEKSCVDKTLARVMTVCAKRSLGNCNHDQIYVELLCYEQSEFNV